MKKGEILDILNFEKQHVKEASALALANYYEERQFVRELPQVCDIPDLNGFSENGLGVAAFENEKMIGFLCCLDAIRPMKLIDCKPCADYDFAELSKTECHSVYPLHLALYRHYCESPFFMNRKPETQEEFMVSSMQEGERYFVAKILT